MLGLSLRRAGVADAPSVAAIHRVSRQAVMPWLADLHSPAEDLAFFRDDVLAHHSVWVAEHGRVVGFCAFRDGSLDHLYVLPEYQRRGIGTLLLDKAKERNDRLELWTFQRNDRARSFYEANGFSVIGKTDGRNNEEGEPDVLYRWTRPPAMERRQRGNARAG